LLQSPTSVAARQKLETAMRKALSALWPLRQVGDIRQVGLIAGLELVKDWRTRATFDLRQRAGMRVCEAMARHGVLTRPIGNVIVLMPPYCTTPAQMEQIASVISRSIKEVLGGRGS
jgi:adenosylmethionine-8-amino-7-oxononanoate aminotransferase